MFLVDGMQRTLVYISEGGRTGTDGAKAGGEEGGNGESCPFDSYFQHSLSPTALSLGETKGKKILFS